MQQLVIASARKPSALHKGVRRMEIEPADNGFVAMTHHHGGKDEPYPEPERKVFMDHEDLGNHVKQTFGGGKVSKSKEKDGKPPAKSEPTQPKQGKETAKAAPKHADKPNDKGK